MTRFRLKPVEVDAVRWTGDNIKEVEELTGDVAIAFPAQGNYCLIGSNQTRALVHKGDWIVRNENLTISVYSTYAFDAKYELVPFELSDPAVDNAEWTEMVAEMQDPATAPCSCGYPVRECLQVVLRNGPPYGPRPCDPVETGKS